VIVQRAFAGALLALALPAFADAPPDCSGTQNEMTRCAANTMAIAETGMASALDAARDAAQDEAATALLDRSQTAWAAYRDAQRAFEADAFRGGSIARSIELSCADALTRARTAALRDATIDAVDQPTAEADRETFWEVAWGSDLNGDGAFDDARLGVRATGDPNAPLDAILDVRIAGRHEPLRATIPVDSDALCGPPLPMRIESADAGAPPNVVVEDGLCDAFRFSVVGDPSTLRLNRN